MRGQQCSSDRISPLIRAVIEVDKTARQFQQRDAVSSLAFYCGREVRAHHPSVLMMILVLILLALSFRWLHSRKITRPHIESPSRGGRNWWEQCG